MLLYVSLIGALWTFGVVQLLLIVSTAALATAWTLPERYSNRDLGLDPVSIDRGWWIAPVGAAIAGLILLAAWRGNSLRLPANSVSVYVGILLYLIWALIQQFLLESFFFLRIEHLLGSRRAVIATALLFASAHIPNPVLVPVTFVGGLILCELFRRYRTIYLLAVAQALVALALSISVPETVLHDMRVGIGYIYYPK